VTAPNLSPGSTIAGKYTVRALLAYSGASATYHAVSAQGYEVAVKLFSPAVAQRPDIMQMIERIYAETNALTAELAAPIIDAGYDPATGAPFGVTQIVSIPSLAQLVGRRPLSGAETASMLKSMSRALDNAHIREIMHHAVKPTNVFVDPSSSHATRLMDFGANLSRSVVPTHEGYAMSAPWMAPEQLTGTVPAGAQADVFGAALVAFFALTGQSYWRSCAGAQPNVQAWQQEIMVARTPASARASEIGLRVSPQLDPVFARALAHEPHDRYRTVGEFAAAFEAALGAREPEMAATMAFPAVTDAHMPAGYGPPPTPSATGDGGYPPAPTPYTGASAYTATMPSSTAMVAPNPAPAAPPLRSASGRLAPVMVGAVALLLVGGGVAAWLMMGSSTTTPTTVSTPQSASAAVAAPPTAPTTTAQAPQPTETTAAPQAPVNVDAKITCSPACGEILVDDQKVEDATKAIPLAPGSHKVTVSKTGYASQTESITIEAGKPFSKEFKLVADKPVVASTPPKNPTGGGSPGPGPTPIKKCGKLIKTNCK
jgi:eukaryotic-like serine/threonine-protein kinase